MRININKACTNPQAKITPKRQSPRAYRSGIRTLKSPSKACFPANVRKPTNARKKALRGRFCVSQRHRIQPVETNQQKRIIETNNRTKFSTHRAAKMAGFIPLEELASGLQKPVNNTEPNRRRFSP